MLIYKQMINEYKIKAAIFKIKAKLENSMDLHYRIGNFY